MSALLTTIQDSLRFGPGQHACLCIHVVGVLDAPTVIPGDDATMRNVSRNRLEETYESASTCDAECALTMGLTLKTGTLLLELLTPDFSRFEACDALTSSCATPKTAFFFRRGRDLRNRAATFGEVPGASEYFEALLGFGLLKVQLMDKGASKEPERQAEIGISLRVSFEFKPTHEDRECREIPTLTGDVRAGGFLCDPASVTVGDMIDVYA
jgi:hypothetical protein